MQKAKRSTVQMHRLQEWRGDLPTMRNTYSFYLPNHEH